MVAESDTGQLPFFRDKIGPRLKPQTRLLFEKYSGIAPEEVEAHLYAIVSIFCERLISIRDPLPLNSNNTLTYGLEQRDRAWSLQKYPCVGQWVFLFPRMPQLPWYPDIVSRLQHGSSILDIGCCFGQDLRFLAADGVPTGNMYASDIVSTFWDLGFDLFRDKTFFNPHFIEADILDTESRLQELKGKVDVFLANQVFHLFNRERQLTMAKNLVGIGTKDVWIVGWQVGSGHGRSIPVGTTTGVPYVSSDSDTRLFHNHETWKELWQQVGEQTGTEWSVETSMQPLEEWGYEKEDTAGMGTGATGFEYMCRRVG